MGWTIGYPAFGALVLALTLILDAKCTTQWAVRIILGWAPMLAIGLLVFAWVVVTAPLAWWKDIRGVRAERAAHDAAT